MNGVSISRKPCAVEKLAHGESNLRAQNDVALHVRAAQIDVAILQAHVFVDVHRLLPWGTAACAIRSGSRCFEATTSTSPVARVRVHGCRAARRDLAFHGDDVLRAEPLGALVDRRHPASAWKTTCVTPSRSRRWMKITPPRSRRRWTQPIRQRALAGRRRRAVRRRCACGEGRLENPAVRSFHRDCRQFQAAAISSRASRFCCSPDDIFFKRIGPAAISLSPTIRANRAPSLFASSMRVSACLPPIRRRCPARRRSRAIMAAVPQRRLPQAER